ncbi:type 2 isopentenyl-diphosphate Delta-isomerase [Paenalkalicoccus suaedae]|uniref:Isopentenyl-diphosphate delta-isomerase n=1 Tax=Paenalkalicoccus suaedae TaxID=2592382 RepID=A0A859FDC5_9BACI|nr:type 2 isopentenyl-diphosphate Delta-isomerase [Paenalkalicoccus suaedae]QKS71077.1 type 2 isopentenyl-diphosphate Delta-isomerase [Paenalkalicoccus suaedae]
MSREKRKLDHIEHALKTGQAGDNGLEDVKFVHQSLPNSSVEAVDLSTSLATLSFDAPFMINAMTGGGGTATEGINRQLAEIAAHFHVPIAVGSQMAALRDPDQEQSFKVVREYNKEGLVFANLGSEATVEQAKRACDLIKADLLQIHINTVQELVMPEGDRSFDGALERISQIQEALPIPVMVKEVGFGMSKEAATKLAPIVDAIDVGGYGGTNFSKIENARREMPYSFFDDWGISTAASIVETREGFSKGVSATGGIRSATEIAKSIALGADMCGMAGYVLKLLQNGGQKHAIQTLSHMLEELTFIMTALGASDVGALKQVPLVIQGNTYHWLSQRDLHPEKFARR